MPRDKGQRVSERRVGAAADGVVICPLIAVVEHGGDIARDAAHAPRADRFDARLLDRVEGRAPFHRGGRETAVDRVIVAGEAQRHGIGAAAQNGGVLRRELARRVGEARLGAFLGGDEGRALGREAHVEIGRFRHGAHGPGDGALEGLLRRVLGLRGSAVAAHDSRVLFLLLANMRAALRLWPLDRPDLVIGDSHVWSGRADISVRNHSA